MMVVVVVLVMSVMLMVMVVQTSVLAPVSVDKPCFCRLLCDWSDRSLKMTYVCRNLCSSVRLHCFVMTLLLGSNTRRHNI